MRSLARHIDAGALKRAADDRCNSGTTGEALDRCLCSKEDLPGGTAWPGLAQVLRQRLAHLVWKREAIDSGLSIANQQLAGVPVDVLQL